MNEEFTAEMVERNRAFFLAANDKLNEAWDAVQLNGGGFPEQKLEHLANAYKSLIESTILIENQLTTQDK